jgi:AcrR family transcriptional regulator
MGVKERRKREKENLRQEILDAAREMFAADGFKSVSMRKIAEKIEYSPTTIYLYFKDKVDLLNQICEETFANLSAEIAAVKSADEDALENMRNGLRRYVEFGLRHPKHYEVTFMTPIMGYLGQDAHPFEGSMGQRAFEYLRSEVSACMSAGKIKTGDVDLVSQTIWATIHGITSLLIAHTDFPFVDTDKLIDSVIGTMLDGLKT